MTDHPLTDKVCHKIIDDIDDSKYMVEDVYCEDYMRAAYDKGAADKLEQVREAWQELGNSNRTYFQIFKEFDKQLKAMRPQQQEDNND